MPIVQEQTPPLPGAVTEDDLTQSLEAVIDAGEPSQRAAETVRQLREQQTIAAARRAGADDSDGDSRSASRKPKRMGTTFKDQPGAKLAYTGQDAAELLTEGALGGGASTAAASASAAADGPTLPPRKDNDDDMTDAEAETREELKSLRTDIDHERNRRKELEAEVKRLETERAEAERVLGTVCYTTTRLIDAVNKDEQIWQNAIVVIKKKTLKMHEYYTRMNTLEIHLKTKQDTWQNVVVTSSAGPATTLIMKTKTSQQAALDSIKTWASTEGVSR